MPPHGFRKRVRSPTPPPATSSKKRKAPATVIPTSTKKAKPTLFDTVDAPSKKPVSLEESRNFLEGLDEDDQLSSPSEADSDDFEDVPAAKRQKTSSGKKVVQHMDDGEDDDDDDEMDWEDAIQTGQSSHATPAAATRDDDEIGDVSISLNDDGSYIEPLVSAATGKKGPSKRERRTRDLTHRMHAMTLMWHNTIRNSWLNDKQAKKMLVDGLPDGVAREVKRWRQNLDGLGKGKPKEVKQPVKSKGKRGKKEKSAGRDWNGAAESQEPDSLQATNALLRLLKVLAAYWRKRFTVTTPGLRKQGYKDLRRLKNDVRAWEKDHKHVEDHGERIETVQDFRECAKACEGSRDVGGQLFVSLLRGIGLETRMVASLQPAGFGWSKAEEADPPKTKKKGKQVEEVESETDVEVKVVSTKSSKETDSGKKAKGKPKEKPSRKSVRGNKTDPINLDDSGSSLSEAPSDVEEPNQDNDEDEDKDDELSVVDVTPSLPKKKPHRKYDRDLAFPIYWAEVCDPVSHRYFPVDPVVLSTIASSDELLQSFEPRGKKAEVSKQVICYVMAYSSDGTAKDVTVRYIKRHQLPGKTKGMRMPVERVPIHNRHGKVKRYEEYDWFRTLASLYDRPEAKRSTADDLEDATDLKPFKPSKEEKVVEKESLQGYKQSAEFVLETHFRREEALLPGSQPVKTFTAGKGDKAIEHDVYLRKDVVVCKTVESWHKEGRAIRAGEQPLKYVPVRAVTLIRKREMEDAQRETGEKLKQGLYSEAQTDWIIPPPIENGVIPKNAFGNMDVYVPTMVPRGAVHLPLKGSAKLCRKLGIDYAEACTGFEFGKQRAVPVLTGVVVAKENQHMVRDAWRVEQEEQKRKADIKRTATALHWWRKMLLGLRVLERMRVEYADAGGSGEEVNPFVLKARREGRETGGPSGGPVELDDDDMGGGFMRDEDEQASPAHNERPTTNGDGGGFLLEGDDANAMDGIGGGGGFLVEDGDEEELNKVRLKNHAPITPVSLQSIHKNANNDVDVESEDEEEEVVSKPNKKAVQKAPSRPSRAKTKQKRRATPKITNRRKTVVSDDDEENESSLSSLASSSASEDQVDTDSNDESILVTVADGARRRSSPQVVISPPKKSTPAGRKTRNVAKKATPLRSPYFVRRGDEDKVVDEEEDVESEESEEEVVKPRATTARTRVAR